MDVGDITDPNLDGDFRALLEARQVLLDFCFSFTARAIGHKVIVIRSSQKLFRGGIKL